MKENIQNRKRKYYTWFLLSWDLWMQMHIYLQIFCRARFWLASSKWFNQPVESLCIYGPSYVLVGPQNLRIYDGKWYKEHLRIYCGRIHFETAPNMPIYAYIYINKYVLAMVSAYAKLAKYENELKNAHLFARRSAIWYIGSTNNEYPGHVGICSYHIPIQSLFKTEYKFLFREWLMRYKYSRINAKY